MQNYKLIKNALPPGAYNTQRQLTSQTAVNSPDGFAYYTPLMEQRQAATLTTFNGWGWPFFIALIYWSPIYWAKSIQKGGNKP